VIADRVPALVRGGVTVGVLAWAVRTLDPAAARAALGGFGWDTIALSLALVAIDRVLMLQRWLLLIRPATTLARRELTRIFFVSAFLGSFLPAGVGGDAARAWSISRRTGQAGPAVASVLVDRWLGLLAVGVSGCVGVWLSLAALPDGARPLLVLATLLLAIGALAGLFADRLVTRLLPEAARRVWLGRAVVRLSDALASYRGHGGALKRVAVLSLAVQSLRILLAWVLGLGLGIALPFSYYWVFMPINILVILLPVSVGGFGLPQGTMIWTLAPLGVDATAAFLLSTLFVGIGIIGNLPGIWLYLRGPDRAQEMERS
jgi:glycosyltransferase 2 family protein